MERDAGWNLTRANILTIISENKKPISIKDLQKKSKIPRTTLYHHLNQLKKRNLIIEQTDKEATGEFEQGHPVYLKTNTADALSSKTINLMLKMKELFKK